MSRMISGAGIGTLAIIPPPPAPEPDALPIIDTYPAPASFLAQPSTGKVVRAAQRYGAEIFLGYGDYSGNTGPIDVVAFDMTARQWAVKLAAAPTEEFNVFREIGGWLYAPWIDSHPSMPYLGYSTNQGGVWHNVDDGDMGALHNFDMASFTGDPLTDLFMAGSDILADSQGHGIVYRSTDGGATWGPSLELGPGGFSRVTAMAKYGAWLFATGNGVTYFYDGSSWSTWTGVTPIPLNNAFTALGLLVDQQNWFDGTVSAKHKVGSTDTTFSSLTVDGQGRLWGTSSNHLYAASTVNANGPVWTRVGHLNYEDFQAARIVVDDVNDILFVVSASALVRTAPLPATP